MSAPMELRAFIKSCVEARHPAAPVTEVLLLTQRLLGLFEYLSDAKEHHLDDCVCALLRVQKQMGSHLGVYSGNDQSRTVIPHGVTKDLAELVVAACALAAQSGHSDVFVAELHAAIERFKKEINHKKGVPV